MAGFKSLSTRLVVAMLIPLSLLLLVATWVETRQASRVMIKTGETAASNLAATVKEELQGVLRSTKIGIQALGIGLKDMPDIAEEDAVAFLREAVERFPLLYGTALAFETNSPPGDAVAPYVFRSRGEIRQISLANEQYRYWEQDWYTSAMKAGSGIWTPPYRDDGGGDTRMVTYAEPLTIGDKKAVLTADLSLTFLSEIAKSSLLGRPGAVLVFDRGGRMVTHPVNAWLFDKRLSQIAAEQRLSALASVPAAIANGQELWLRPEDGMHEGLIGGDPSRPGRLLVIPLREANWGIGVYFSDEVFLEDIQAATRFRLLFSLALLILLASVMAMVSLRSLRPLGELASRTRAIARGEFHGQTPGQNRRDEIGQLSRAFHRMQDQLQHYIEDLTQATAARERMEAELTTARLLQHALLPPENPDPLELGADLAAQVDSAREVGGDLFNYMASDDGRILFVVGDVSDKGVPAALFMTRTNALIKAAVIRGGTPDSIIASVNQALCDENELCMFVTLLVGELHLAEGRLVMASAGHDAPILVGKDGKVEELQVETGPPLGIDEDGEYPVFESRIELGEYLVTFTDGVTEARSTDGAMFGVDGLLHALAKAPKDSSRLLLLSVRDAVDQFAAGEEQADDLTLLILSPINEPSHPEPGPSRGRLEFIARPGCHVDALEQLDKAVRAADCKACDPADLRLITEELLTNIVKYSGTEGSDHPVALNWAVTADHLELVVEDSGVPFNPLEEDEEELSDDERCEGGMGIMLVRALSDSIVYSRERNINRLTLTFTS